MKISNQIQNDLKLLIEENLEHWRGWLNPNPECKKLGYCDCEDACMSVQLTVGLSNTGEEWSYQTGDNSYSGGAYCFPHWAVIWCNENETPEEVYKNLIQEIDSIEI